MSNVRWLSAYKEDKKTWVDIANAPSGLWYYCPNCGERMYATHGKSLGKTQEDHFRHDKGKECNHDSYLHKVAIERFLSLFEHCIEAHLPLPVKVRRNKRCDALCALVNTDCPNRRHYTIIDLAQLFNRARKEQSVFDGRYRADILLESNGGDQLWVEIWVKHKTEKEKIEAAKGEVLEIRINSDDDTRLISANRLAEGQLDIVYFGTALSPIVSCEAPVLTEKEEDLPAVEDYLPGEIESYYPTRQARPLSTVSFNSQSEPPSIDKPFWRSPKEAEWIDLGLPSGTLWSAELMGVMNYEEIQKAFPGMIPSQEQFIELLTCCTMGEGSSRAFLTGPNGKRLELYEGSFWTTSATDDMTKKVALHREFVGKPVLFTGEAFILANKQLRLCVRLVK